MFSPLTSPSPVFFYSLFSATSPSRGRRAWERDGPATPPKHAAKELQLPKQKLTSFFTAYYIAFGAHGPRALPPPGEGWKVAAYTAIGVGVSFAIFATIRAFAGPAPNSMNKEYQEATNEYLKVRFIVFYFWFGCLEDEGLESGRIGWTFGWEEGWDRGRECWGENRIGLGAVP